MLEEKLKSRENLCFINRQITISKLLHVDKYLKSEKINGSIHTSNH